MNLIRVSFNHFICHLSFPFVVSVCLLTLHPLSLSLCLARLLTRFLFRSVDRWLMANQGKGKSRRSLSQLMRQVINIWDSIMIQSSTFLEGVVMNLNHSVCLGSVVSLQLWEETCWGSDGVTYQSIFVVVNRGTSTRPFGRTHGRLWRVQITGMFEIKPASADLRPKGCATWTCEWSPTLIFFCQPAVFVNCSCHYSTLGADLTYHWIKATS